MSGTVEALPGPTDGISSLSWSSRDHLLATSWDSEVRVWEVGARGCTAVASTSHAGPVLCSAWEPSGAMAVTGGCDNIVQGWDLESGQTREVGRHDAPVKTVVFSDELGGFVSASWDSTLKYWDLRSSAPAHDLVLPQRAFAMDAVSPLLAVACAERQIVLFDMRKPTVEFAHILSPLKFQSRSIAVFPNAAGFALGSIEGRVAIHNVEEKDSAFNFVFKCHRHSNNIYAVNAISFHPQYGTFATAGSDGTYATWDQKSKQRLFQSTRHTDSISAAAFSSTGALFAYAVSYDWHRGAEFYDPNNAVNSVMVASVSDSIVKSSSSAARA